MRELTSFWRGRTLWWRIDGREVADHILRQWCRENMPYPWNHVDLIRQAHLDAWANTVEAT